MYLIMPTTEAGLLKYHVKVFRKVFPNTEFMTDASIIRFEKKQIEEWGFRYQIHKLAGHINLLRERENLKPIPYRWWNYEDDRYLKKKSKKDKRFGGMSLYV